MKCRINNSFRRGRNVLTVFLFVLFILSFSFIQAPHVSATTSTLTLSVIDKLSLNVSSLNSDGVFATSDTDTNNISVSTNNGTGYLLGIKASTEGGNALVNATDSSKTIPSHTITAGVSKTNYNDASYASANNLNNTWGFRPSTYYDTTNNVTINNTTSNLYFPGPSSTTNSFIIDKTTAANATANEYNIALGTRVNSSTAPGKYTDTFIITAVANPTIYSITYNQNTTDTVTNMPQNAINQETYGDSVNISYLVPARDGFNFKGWCTAQVADDASCTGTTYNPDGGGTALAWTLDQTVSSNSLTLYAMWEQAITLQDMTFEDCPTDTAKSVSDARDGESYKVQVLKDGNCWMLDNLRLDLGNSTVLNNTTESNTNASTTTLNYLKNGGGSTSDRYPTAKINNVPWTSSSQNYYSIPMTISTYKDQTTISYGEGSGKIGVYYNYCAASAGNYCFGDGTSAGSPSGNATEDICPKGWRMPTGDSSGEYKALYTAYSSDVTSFLNALSAPLSGNFYDGSASNQGTHGTFWSSTYSYASNMYYLSVNSSGVSPFSGNLRYVGTSVRCLLGS